MPVASSTKEYEVMKELLEGKEAPGVEMVERRRGGAKWFGIAHAYATNHRIIIVRIYPLGFRTSIKIIKYKDIIEVKVERGALLLQDTLRPAGGGPGERRQQEVVPRAQIQGGSGADKVHKQDGRQAALR